MRSRWREYVGTGVVLWVAFTAIEAMLIGKIDPQETPVGAGVAALAATITVAALAIHGERYRLRWSWLVHIPRVLLNVARDTWIVTVALLRALAGREPDAAIVELPFAPGGDDAESRARRALAVAAASTSPNSIVLEIDDARGTMRVHYLSAGAAPRPHSERWPL